MKINAFISHRCQEFDLQPIQKGVESFLEQKGLTPMYGCHLNTNFRSGHISENIPGAIRASHIFIAIITKTWAEVTDEIGWPKRELGMWDKRDEFYRPFIMGFLFDIERRQIDYIRDFDNFPTKNESNEQYNQFLFNDGHNAYYVRKKDNPVIQNKLDGYIELIQERMENQRQAEEIMKEKEREAGQSKIIRRTLGVK